MSDERPDRDPLSYAASDYRWTVEQVDGHSWRVVSAPLNSGAAHDTARALTDGIITPAPQSTECPRGDRFCGSIGHVACIAAPVPQRPQPATNEETE